MRRGPETDTRDGHHGHDPGGIVTDRIAQRDLDPVERVAIELGDVQETLLIPLYGRAVETRKRDPIMRDPRAVEMVESIDYDFHKFDGARSLMGSVLRGEILDTWVRRFIEEHPEGTVVEVGAGLNTRFERLDDGRIHWVDLDLPDAMALRRRFFEETDRRTMIGCSIVDPAWVETVAALPGPYCFVAEAVLIYLPEADVRTSLALMGRFPGARIALDTWGDWIRRNQHRHDVLKALPARVRWTCDDPRVIESWDPGFRLLGSTTLAGAPRHVTRGRPGLRAMLLMMGLLPQVRAYQLDLFEVAGR